MFRKWIDKIKDNKQKKQAARISAKMKDYETSRTMSLPMSHSSHLIDDGKSDSLPPNFAKKLISLEIQCERPDATQAHVNQLMDLYTVSSLCSNFSGGH